MVNRSMCARGVSLVGYVLGVVASVILTVAPASADRCASALRRLEGWTILSVTSVDGEFNGCDFDRVIRFTDGSVHRCSTYSYTYSYRPDAIIFGKTMSYQGGTYTTIKVLIEGDIYDMSVGGVRAR